MVVYLHPTLHAVQWNSAELGMASQREFYILRFQKRALIAAATGVGFSLRLVYCLSLNYSSAMALVRILMDGY